MLKLQIGPGLDGPDGWLNVDASPTLRLQRLPVVGALLGGMVGPKFSSRVVFGDVAQGLRLADGSVEIVYSSHVLEHLAFDDLLRALREVHRVLRPGGVFRSVLPDLQYEVDGYIKSTAADPASELMRSTLLGVEHRERGFMGVLRAWLGNSRHVWMWDFKSMAYQLGQAGFVQIRSAAMGDSDEVAYLEVESAERWQNALGFECRKPG